jgi:hypothetical protein
MITKKIQLARDEMAVSMSLGLSSRVSILSENEFGSAKRLVAWEAFECHGDSHPAVWHL